MRNNATFYVKQRPSGIYMVEPSMTHFGNIGSNKNLRIYIKYIQIKPGIDPVSAIISGRGLLDQWSHYGQGGQTFK